MIKRRNAIEPTIGHMNHDGPIMRKIRSLVALVAFFCSASIAAENVARSADYLFFKDKLDTFIANPAAWHSRADNNSPLKNPYPGLMTVADGYSRMPVMAAMVKAFRLTQDDTYAQKAYDSALEYINDGRQRTTDSFQDWYAGEYNPVGGGYNHEHYEWRAAAGIGMLLSALIDVGGSVASAANKQVLAEFLRDHVWLKWQPYAIENGTASEGNTNTFGTSEVSRIGHFAIALDKYYGSPEYGSWINGKGAIVAAMITANTVDGACTNIQFWIDNTHGVMDTSHATQLPEFVVEAHEAGYAWATLSVVQALGNGLNTIIWDTSGGFHANTDGTGILNSRSYGFNMGGFFALLPYTPARLSDYVTWAKTTVPYGLQYEAGAWMSANLMTAL